MKSIRCSFYVASILILITQVAMAQGSESFNGQGWLNKKDASMIIKFENIDKLDGLQKSLQDTPDLQSFIIFGVNEQGTPGVGEPDEPDLKNAPIGSEEICVKYPFVEGCSQ